MPNEKMQPIQWIEQPTGALVRLVHGSFWFIGTYPYKDLARFDKKVKVFKNHATY
jgi:hypothetical protein